MLSAEIDWSDMTQECAEYFKNHRPLNWDELKGAPVMAYCAYNSMNEAGLENRFPSVFHRNYEENR